MIDPALEQGALDLTAVLAALRDQEAHGHTAATDADRKLACFADDLRRRSSELGDVLIPGERQNLGVAYRRAARLAAYAVATMRRIRVEQGRDAHD